MPRGKNIDRGKKGDIKLFVSSRTLMLELRGVDYWEGSAYGHPHISSATCTNVYALPRSLAHT